METKNIIFILLFLLSLSSCVKKGKEETRISPNPSSHGTSSTKLYPLNTGNFWIYEETRYDSVGKERKYSFVQKVIGKTVLGKDTFYKINGLSNFYYRSPNDSLTLIADSNGNSTPHFQYNKQANSIIKIGSILIASVTINYYSSYGLVAYRGNLNRLCLLIITEEEVNGIITWKLNKYVQPGVGVIATEIFKLKSDTSAVKEYVLTEKSELKDYFLYP